MRQELILFIIILLVLSCIGLTFEKRLNDLDGGYQFFFAQKPNCDSGYPSFVCWLTKPISWSPDLFWGLFFAIAIAGVPLLLYYFNRKEKYAFKILIGYFFFTGYFFYISTVQTYSQLMLSLFFIYFLYSKNNKTKILVWLLLSIGWFLNIKIHSMELLVLGGIAAIELALYFSNHKVFNFLPACAPVVTKTTEVGTEIRLNVMHSQYYFVAQVLYYVFVRSMFFAFSIPALIHIVMKKDLRHIFYLLLIFCGTFFIYMISSWYYDPTLTMRVMIWIPLVLLVPFLDWLENRKSITRKAFWILGLAWFIAQVYWWLVGQVFLLC